LNNNITFVIKVSTTGQRLQESLEQQSHITTFGAMQLTLHQEWRARVKPDAFRYKHHVNFVSTNLINKKIDFMMQVTEETSAILRHFGYQFEQRGLVFVKGKGQLLTYYLIESDASVT
jgi:hypothetical protein